MAIISRINERRRRAEETALAARSTLSLNDLIAQVNFMGQNYPIGLQQTHSSNGLEEEPDRHFATMVRNAYQTGGPVFACIVARGALFTEARFQWQRIDRGRPGDLFGNQALAILEKPWPRGTTGDLLMRAEQDVSLGGNFYVRLAMDRLWRLRPDYMTIVLGSRTDAENPADAPDAEVIGYIYKAPGGDPVKLGPEEVAHWAPIPDPLANYRGMSWVAPLVRDIEADNLAIVHKGQFFRRAATVNVVVMPDASVTFDEFKRFKDEFLDDHEGSFNAYKTLFLGGGSKIEKVGMSMKDMDYKGLMGISETRIASAANVPPIIAGFSEGLASATYSNYGMARRKFGDHFARPQWRSFAGAISPLLDQPQGSDSGQVRLWYDDRDIAFLREDSGDEATIRQTEANTIRTLIDGGYLPDAAATFAATGNPDALIGQHSGRLSVQLIDQSDVESDADSNDDEEDDEPTPPGFNTDDEEDEDS